MKFTEHLIMAGFGYSFGLALGDLAGSGRLDITAADADGRALYWFANEGEGRFTRRMIQRDHPKERLERHAFGDVSGSGRLDVVIVENLTGDLYWFENPGPPFGDECWRLHEITIGGMPLAYDVALADLNGNDRLDVAASGWRANQIAWFENPGSDGGPWGRHAIDGDLAEARTIRVADFDGDGRPDLLATGVMAGQVVWYQNPGGAGEWKRHVIDGATPRPVHGEVVDMDGDGGCDVVMATGMQADAPGSVVWYEADGDRTGSWRKHVICADLPQAYEAVAADLDGDGAMEVVATTWGENGGLHLFRHDGDPRGSWEKETIRDGWPRANQLAIGDLDGDGRPDIVAQAERGTNELRWWRNLG